MAKLRLYRSLLLFGILQALTNLGFMALALAGKSYPLMIAVVAAENLCGGMGTAAFVALLMALCDRRFSATQYALLSALAAFGRVYVGPAAGSMVAGVRLAGVLLLHVPHRPAGHRAARMGARAHWIARPWRCLMYVWQKGMGWFGILIVLAIAAGAGYYAYKGIVESDEAPSCAAAQNACLRNCRRTTTEAAAAQSCQQDCQRGAAACGSATR